MEFYSATITKDGIYNMVSLKFGFENVKFKYMTDEKNQIITSFTPIEPCSFSNKVKSSVFLYLKNKLNLDCDEKSGRTT